MQVEETAAKRSKVEEKNLTITVTFARLRVYLVSNVGGEGERAM